METLIEGLRTTFIHYPNALTLVIMLIVLPFVVYPIIIMYYLKDIRDLLKGIANRDLSRFIINK